MTSRALDIARRARRRTRDRIARINAARLGPEPSFSRDTFSPRIKEMRPFLGGYTGRHELKLLEVGSYEGGSTLWFLANVLTGERASITCIDVWGNLRQELYFDHNVRVSGYRDKVQKIKGDSHEALQDLEHERFSIVYIDGNHRACHVLLDAILAWPLLESGGLMMFDDYLWESHRPSSERPKLAIDIFVELYGANIEILFKGYMAIIRKT
jgi:predicted O-methyltransferase YrrM